jgi:photosystem II stability/assembly factor-like uncharacterized protein
MRSVPLAKRREGPGKDGLEKVVSCRRPLYTVPMRPALILGFLAASLCHAQFTLQTSNTAADLRGIHSAGNGVAWASGTNGTVLRTEDGGYVWQSCRVPTGADKLDFRGIQAFDANTAIVMSSGKGDLSRLYKTTDGCHTWKLVFTNPDEDGFWDAIIATRNGGLLIGDPVDGRFAIYGSSDSGLEKWERIGEKTGYLHFRFDLSPYEGEGLFAASNSSAMGSPTTGAFFVTGGPKGSFFVYGGWSEHGRSGYPIASFAKIALPLAKGQSAGAFSISCSVQLPSRPKLSCISVGGDYLKPDSIEGTAAYTSNIDNLHKKWTASKTPPHGYRSAVAYDPTTKTWITVGPNGTDVSTDDGKNWHALQPDPAMHEAADADRNWNALSLPFVVGPHGRIGKLDAAALKH